ncbi:MAG: G3E family GTPase [Psychromonas sp.]|jgi:G3E family GTPase|uniref:GTP-binding protein n=1 Tax=Psychromonas sp. TaxID=1884585 RepID=UPI0039E37507
MKKEIPCHLIAGFLGSGKTTFIKQLLSYKPSDEKWAVLVNESGNNLYPHENYKTNKIFISEVYGGCLCCSAGMPFRVALNNLIKQVRPDRLFIEPAGAGHLNNIKQLLQGPFYQDVVQLQPIICILSEQQLSNQKYAGNQGYQALITQADKLCISTAHGIKMAYKYAQPLYLLQGSKADFDFIKRV